MNERVSRKSPQQAAGTSDDTESNHTGPNDTGPNNTGENGAGKPNGSNGAGSAERDAVALLRDDHRTVERCFEAFKSARRRAEKERLVREICTLLVVHTILEEEIFYPACRDHVDDGCLDEAQVEHDAAKLLMRELAEGAATDPYYDAKVQVLAEQIRHHVAEEEKPGGGIFAQAGKGGLDLKALGRKLAARRTELLRLAESDRLPRPAPRSSRMQASPTPNATPRPKMEEDTMAQYYQQDYGSGRGSQRGRSSGNDRPRDEYGRFMSEDDDDDDRRSSGNSGRSRAAANRERDEYGRFVSEDDDRRGRSGSSGGGGGGGRRARYEDDDDRRSGGGRRASYDDDDDRRGGGGGRRTGGWFGDPEGHSRASREGWRSSDHEGSGWYGDPEGHSRASREGWRNSDHEGSGWYGDPEGHSQAARRGWDSRDDDYGRDERRSSSSSRGQGRSSYGGRDRDDEYDDRRSGRGGRSQGGWFGDSRGHAEAARRGWDDRR